MDTPLGMKNFREDKAENSGYMIVTPEAVVASP